MSHAASIRPLERPLVFELFVAPRFNCFEAAAVTQALSAANALTGKTLFEWKFVSHKPGIVKGSDGFLVRAAPAIDNHGFADVMVIVGAQKTQSPDWINRVRGMRRQGRTVVLLSDTATAYIKALKHPKGRVTTHWRDVTALQETGFHPKLTLALSEMSDGVITAAGHAATCELVIALIAPLLSSADVSALGNQLLLPLIRKSDAEQPKGIADNPALYDARIIRAVKLMEDTLSDPLSVENLTTEIGVSARHLERVFRAVFDQSPARFYKQLRTRRARVLVEETPLPLAEIAAATGFGSSNTMSAAVRAEYGVSPTQMRARKDVSLLKYDERP